MSKTLLFPDVVKHLSESASGTVFDKPIPSKIAAVCNMIRLFYELPDNCVGGPLHIVTDDHNWEDHHIQWCIDNTDDHSSKALGHALLWVNEEERFEYLSEWREISELFDWKGNKKC